MARLSLRLLGGFLLQADGRPRPLPARKAQALLAYLAVRAGRAHARDTLTALLWADSGGRQARQSLRQTMVRLRRALAGSPGVLVVQGDTVLLDPGRLDVDVAAFERLVRRATPEALEDAAALYAGPLLDGVPVSAPVFEEWLATERARLGELALEALRRLLDRHLKDGRVEAAIQAATRLLALDPLHEDVHRALMQLHVRHGRRAVALRQYQACVAALQKELGVEPEAATRRLYLEILQRPAPAAGVRAAGAGRAGRPAADAPLVGRDAEMTRLHQRLRAAWRGEGQVIFLVGEAGIGKSRLVDELAAAALARGGRLLTGRAHETEQILPFQPWIDAFRTGQALAALRDGAVGAPPGRGELARLFPELAAGEAPAPITDAGHHRLFESLDAVLGALATGQPLLVVLEDVQWADDMSLRLLAFVGRRLGARPILLVASAREEDLGAASDPARIIDELTALAHVERVRLEGLSRAATAALVRALARRGSSGAGLADTVEGVWALSEGNPFVVVETMRALRERRPADARRLELPQRVREVISARLARLTPRAQEVARVAAVFSREFEFAVLQRAAGLGRRETAAAVEELVRRRILDAVGERFDFTHARLRQAVDEDLLAPRRQALHAAVGEAMESVYAGRLHEVYDRLVFHFSRADEPGRALTYLVDLADTAARSYALDDAVRLLEDALAASDRLPAAEAGPRRLGIVYRLALVLSALGRSAEACDRLRGHAAVVAALDDPKLTGRFHFWLAYTCGNLGDSAQAVAHAQRALQEAARSDDIVTMGRAGYALARESYMLGRPGESIAHGRQAVAVLEGTDEPWWLCRVLGVLGLTLLHVGDFGPALKVLERMRALAEGMGEVRLQAEAAWVHGRVHTVTGDVEAAIAACQRAVELASDPVARAIALGWLGAAHLEGGDAARALVLLDDAVGQLQRLSEVGGYRYRQMDAILRALLSEGHLAGGDVDRARAIGADALAIAQAGGFRVAIGYAERAVGRAEQAAGRLDAAEAALDRAVRTFVGVEARAQAARSRLSVAALRAAAGDKDAAAAELQAASAELGAIGAPRLVERARRLAEELGLRLAAAGVTG
jgi:DNA-binding SARP family transcriptional activator